MADKTGLVFDSFNFKIEQGKIKEFVQAIGDSNPIYYHEEEAKMSELEGIPMPLTFPTVIDMWGGMNFNKLIEMLELNPLNVLHGEQEYEYFSMVYAGDILTVFPKVVRHVTKAGMDFITIETSYRKDDETVFISRSTIIERHGGGK
ncbi:MaoC family dehydratase N-terminal domain-containing protein [Bacillus aquiflavi]|uniref:MaoC family dehydratase n=1 Tax=Bacillus aquiflavi TaxID=2672567 RepID=A0A6B3VX82_9BACI|nr:MaoC family dehydratase N-terminal domain-containing protein [Bacillus aquiflavi]MBA4536540.1 MaoC family dehydratase N-terminal domain-containing protein [Bacillus aquiflavi]NEY80907.1 MaoC family dehydratase [Bacillus aquiflavi]